MIEILGLDSKILAVLSNMLLPFVSAQRLPHIESIFAIFPSCRVVTIVVDHTTEDAVAGRTSSISARTCWSPVSEHYNDRS